MTSAQLPPNIVLIGFMGAGKSLVADRVARELSWKVCHIDQVIAAEANSPSVAAIIDTHGEPYFRQLESASAQRAGLLQGTVISTGGGIISRPENMVSLRALGGFVVYLRASFEAISERLVGDTTRPLFRDKEKARSLFKSRSPIYESNADLIIDTDDLSVEEVSSRLLEELHRAHS